MITDENARERKKAFVHFMEQFTKRYQITRGIREHSLTLFANTAVQNYLFRNSSEVSFCKSRPVLNDNLASFFENEIYQNSPFSIPFRRETSRAELEESMNQLLNESAAENPNPDISLQFLPDTYRIRQMICDFENPGYHFSDVMVQSKITEHSKFVITAGYSSTFVHILDTRNQKTLATLFIPSLSTPPYFRAISDNYNLKRYFTSTLSQTRYQQTMIMLQEKFQIDASKALETVIDDKENRMRYVINCRMIPDTDPTQFNKIILIRESIGTLIENSKITLLDASHSLFRSQSQEIQCLYGCNFAIAVRNMLSDKQIAEQVMQLAANLETDLSAARTLTDLFKEDLKRYLTCYYSVKQVDNSGWIAFFKRTPSWIAEEKTAQEVELFHNRQLWNLGIQAIKNHLQTSQLPPSEQEEQAFFGVL